MTKLGGASFPGGLAPKKNRKLVMVSHPHFEGVALFEKIKSRVVG